MRRLISAGLAKFFSHTPVDVKENALLQSLRADIDEFKPKIRSVYIRFVFTGNPKRAEEADTLKDLKEQIEERRYLINESLAHDVDLRVQFLITETLKRVVLDGTLLPSAFSFMHNGVYAVCTAPARKGWQI